MDLTSIEISRSLLQLLRDLPEDGIEGFVDTLRFQVAETAHDAAASLASQGGGVGALVLNRQDGSATVLTLEVQSN